MAQLIQMKHYIRTIETIHKITHAMRLVSMSHHSRLKAQENNFKRYVQELHTLFLKLKMQTKNWQHAIFYPSNTTGKQLVIVVSSQKGLSGNFNNTLFKFLEAKILQTPGQIDIIAVGKKGGDYVRDHHLGRLVLIYPSFSYNSIKQCIKTVLDCIIAAQGGYETVTIFFNEPKSFFTQLPNRYTLIPFLTQEEEEMPDLRVHMLDHTWYQEPEVLLSECALHCFEATLHNIFFRSLLAEQAARFLSMDGATRNAKNLLEATRLQYNKLRQAKITREIIELSDMLS